MTKNKFDLGFDSGEFRNRKIHMYIYIYMSISVYAYKYI